VYWNRENQYVLDTALIMSLIINYHASFEVAMAYNNSGLLASDLNGLSNAQFKHEAFFPTEGVFKRVQQYPPKRK